MNTCLYWNAGRGRGRVGGFTLVELLVVIAMLAILTSLGLIGTRRALRAAAKASDLNNVRNMGAISLSMAGDNAGRLPYLRAEDRPGVPFWFSSEAREDLESSGLSKDACYCTTRNLDGGKPDFKWWATTGVSSGFHYAYLANDAPDGIEPWFGDSSSVMRPSSNEFRGSMKTLDNPNKVFARTLADETWYSELWVSLCYEGPGAPLSSAVMVDGKPLGMNKVMVDGSALWVPYADVERRFQGPGVTLYW